MGPREEYTGRAATKVRAAREEAGIAPGFCLSISLMSEGLPAPALAAAAFTVAVVPAATATAAATATFEAAAESAEVARAAVSRTAAEATAGPAAAKAAAEATTAGSPAACTEGAWLGLEAVTAVHRAVAARFEGNLRVFATRCTGRIKELPRGSSIASAEPACFAVLLLL